MPDVTSIAAFITSIKNATDIAKALKDVDVSLEKAETKLKMAELISALADAKIQAAEIQDLIKDKENRIVELEKAFELKSNLRRQGDGYYEVDSSENLFGDPYCSHCWEANHKTIHLHYTTSVDIVCPRCKNKFYYRNVPSLGRS